MIYDDIADTLNKRYVRVYENHLVGLDSIDALCTIKNTCYDLAYCFSKTYPSFDKKKFLQICFERGKE